MSRVIIVLMILIIIGMYVKYIASKDPVCLLARDPILCIEVRNIESR